MVKCTILNLFMKCRLNVLMPDLSKINNVFYRHEVQYSAKYKKFAFIVYANGKSQNVPLEFAGTELLLVKECHM